MKTVLGGGRLGLSGTRPSNSSTGNSKCLLPLGGATACSELHPQPWPRGRPRGLRFVPGDVGLSGARPSLRRPGLLLPSSVFSPNSAALSLPSPVSEPTMTFAFLRGGRRAPRLMPRELCQAKVKAPAEPPRSAQIDAGREGAGGSVQADACQWEGI